MHWMILVPDQTGTIIVIRTIRRHPWISPTGWQNVKVVLPLFDVSSRYNRFLTVLPSSRYPTPPSLIIIHPIPTRKQLFSSISLSSSRIKWEIVAKQKKFLRMQKVFPIHEVELCHFSLLRSVGKGAFGKVLSHNIRFIHLTKGALW
jgi:hypothetical protein